MEPKVCPLAVTATVEPPLTTTVPPANAELVELIVPAEPDNVTPTSVETVCDKPPLKVTVPPPELVALTAAVAAAVTPAPVPPVEVIFKAVKPVKPLALTTTVPPLVRLIVSTPVTVAAVGFVMLASDMTLKISLPKPPSIASPVVQTAAPARSPALNVSSPEPPTNAAPASTPVVSGQI